MITLEQLHGLLVLSVLIGASIALAGLITIIQSMRGI